MSKLERIVHDDSNGLDYILSQNQASVGSFASALYLFSRHRCLNITARIEVYLSRFFYRMG